MPIYLFRCINCKTEQEFVASYEDLENLEKTATCKKCGGQLVRKLAPFVSHFNYTRGK